MDVLTLDRVLILTAFLGVLGLVWLAIRLKAPGAQKPRQGRALNLIEVLPVGADSRAILLQVRGQEVLIVTSKKSGTAMVTLGATPPVMTGAA